MSRRNNFPTPGIILKTLTLRESDRLVSLLTAELGKITALVRGAMNSRRRFMAGIDIMDCGDFLIRAPSQRSSFYTIEQLTGRKFWPTLRESILKYSLASWCLEVTELASPEDDREGRTFFSLLVATLDRLNDSDNASECFAVSINFNMTVLQLAGFDPLAHESTADVQSASWWLQMREQGIALPPPAKTCIPESITKLTLYWEGELGQALKTKQDLLRTVAQWQHG